MVSGGPVQNGAKGKVDFTMTDFRVAQIVRKRMRTTHREVSDASHLSGVRGSLHKLGKAGIVASHEPDVLAWKRFAGTAVSAPGRPQHWLTLSRDLGYLIGVDIAHQGVSVTITGAEFGPVLEAVRREPVQNLDDDPERALDTAAELVAEVFAEAQRTTGASPEQVIGIGVGLPAPVNRRTKRVAPEMHILSAWSGYEPEAELSMRLREILPDVSIEIDNDASLGALGVHSWETLRNPDPRKAPRDLLYVRVGAGIGAGVVIKGKLVGGGTGFAGEIGHVKIDERGHFCPRCGQRGCVETKASEGALLSELAPPVFRKAPSEVTIEEILARDHPACKRSLHEAGWNLGIALAHARTLLDPARIYIGGPLSSSTNYFMRAITQGIVSNSPSLATEKDLVVASPASLPEERPDLATPELLGAIAIALHRCGDRYIERKIGLNQAV